MQLIYLIFWMQIYFHPRWIMGYYKEALNVKKEVEYGGIFLQSEVSINSKCYISMNIKDNLAIFLFHKL